MEQISEELKKKVKELKFEFKDVPQPELLIRVPNANTEVDYMVETRSPEFTSVCPLSPMQPDCATIIIRYAPKKWCVELKSLKYYFTSFRTVAIFHEAVPATILRALTAILEPKWLEVTGQFTVRGGLTTTVTAVYKEK